MKQAKGNMLNIDCDALVITTNGYVKRDGSCVMGRGCAKQVADLVPEIPFMLGAAIKKHGNRVNFIMHQVNTNIDLISYPVKPVMVVNNGTNLVNHMAKRVKIGDSIGGWAAKATMELIIEMAWELSEMADNNPQWKNIILPRPGCGAGELTWEQVEPHLTVILDDRFTCYTY